MCLEMGLHRQAWTQALRWQQLPGTSRSQACLSQDAAVHCHLQSLHIAETGYVIISGIQRPIFLQHPHVMVRLSYTNAAPTSSELLFVFKMWLNLSCDFIWFHDWQRGVSLRSRVMAPCRCLTRTAPVQAQARPLSPAPLHSRQHTATLQGLKPTRSRPTQRQGPLGTPRTTQPTPTRTCTPCTTTPTQLTTPPTATTWTLQHTPRPSQLLLLARRQPLARTQRPLQELRLMPMG